jgi:hypothetical protein
MFSQLSDRVSDYNLYWKRIVVNAVDKKHGHDWQTCIHLDNDFT